MELAPDWPIGWNNHAGLLLRTGHYEEGLEAGLQWVRLMGLDEEGARAAFEAVVRFEETGEPQTTPEPPDWFPGDLAWWYSNVGQVEPALDLIEAEIEAGHIGLMALSHATGTLNALRDDPRYQALLEEAGITW